MGQALYRKYRSRTLDDVVGQEHVTETLAKALKQGRLSHAYLFTGPRGVGKTSVARILAHQINNLPYDDDSSHIDIIEIDAASNRRIDEIRDLRDKIHIAPAAAKYKVYIVDEVHMLTREAFNALLKTLEEPPAHVVFILATTDVHKLPETIVSRTQRFSFKPASEASLTELLEKVAKSEKLDIDKAALKMIVKHGSGSFRDSLSLLDQATSHGDRVSTYEVEAMLGLPSEAAINDLLSLSAGESAAALMTYLTELYNQGYQATALSQSLGQALRQGITNNKLVMESGTTMALLDRLVGVPAAYDPERALEVALLSSNRDLFKSTSLKTADQTMVTRAATKAEPRTKELSKKSAEVETAVQEPEPTASSSEETGGAADLASIKVAVLSSTNWPEVLKTLKKKYNTLYGVVRMAQPDFSEPGKLKLAFGFSFHQKRTNEPANQQKLIAIIKELTGQAVEIECIVDKSAKPPQHNPTHEEDENGAKAMEPASEIAPQEPTVQPKSQEMADISNIFGNAELLES